MTFTKQKPLLREEADLQTKRKYRSHLSEPLGSAGISTLQHALPVAGHHRASPSATLDKRSLLSFLYTMDKV